MVSMWHERCSHCVVPPAGTDALDCPALLLALARGKDVVTPDWVQQVSGGMLLLLSVKQSGALHDVGFILKF